MLKSILHYARHHTLSLDTISRKKCLNIIWKENFITHVRGRLFLPSHDLRKTFEDKIETVVLKIDWTQKPKKNV